MSATLEKRDYHDALRTASAFRDLFPASTYKRWEFAGSLRRCAGKVSDVDHVVIPTWGTVEMGGGLFAEKKQVNLLFHHLDSLLSTPDVRKHIYGATGFRWGDKHRGAEFGGLTHELSLADADNFGPTLCIRTGPPEFSRRIVTALWRSYCRQDDGYAWRCRQCDRCPRNQRAKTCPGCQGTGLIPTEKISVPEERAYFELARVPYVAPAARS